MNLSNFYEEPKHELSDTNHALKDSKGIVVVDFSQIAISTITAMYKPTDELSVDMLRHVILNTLRANVFKYKNGCYQSIKFCLFRQCVCVFMCLT